MQLLKIQNYFNLMIIAIPSKIKTTPTTIKIIFIILEIDNSLEFSSLLVVVVIEGVSVGISFEIVVESGLEV